MMQIEFHCTSFNEGRNRLHRLQPDTDTCGIQNSGATGTVSRGHHGSGDKGLSAGDIMGQGIRDCHGT